MAINWFEGGRRITWLLMAIPAMIGGYNAYDHSPDRVEFFTASPRDGWHFDDNPFSKFSPNRCAKTEYLTDFQIKEGLVRSLALCFKPNEQGKIVYFSPKEETERLKKLEVASARAKEPDAARNAAQAMRKAGYTEAQIADGLGKSASATLQPLPRRRSRPCLDRGFLFATTGPFLNRGMAHFYTALYTARARNCCRITVATQSWEPRPAPPILGG